MEKIMKKIKPSDIEKQWGEDLVKRGVLSSESKEHTITGKCIICYDTGIVNKGTKLEEPCPKCGTIIQDWWEEFDKLWLEGEPLKMKQFIAKLLEKPVGKYHCRYCEKIIGNSRFDMCDECEPKIIEEVKPVVNSASICNEDGSPLKPVEKCCDKCFGKYQYLCNCPCHTPQPEKKQEWTGEKYGVWKIISEMLDNPGESEIYHTSKCYEEIDSLIEKLLSEKEAEVREEIIKAVYEIKIRDFSYFMDYRNAVLNIIKTLSTKEGKR